MAAPALHNQTNGDYSRQLRDVSGLTGVLKIHYLILRVNVGSSRLPAIHGPRPKVGEVSGISFAVTGHRHLDAFEGPCHGVGIKPNIIYETKEKLFNCAKPSARFKNVPYIRYGLTR